MRLVVGFCKKHWKRIALAGTVVFLIVNWDSLLALATFHYWPQSHIEKLQNPIAVKGWTQSGLKLSDGRVLPLPGFRGLPERSEALSRATERGVEITPGGRVIGLIKIWHWCGNDALWNDVRRVDIAHFLEFLRQGEFERPIGVNDPKPYKPGGGFRPAGWNVSEYVLFNHFVKGDRPL